MYTSMFRKAMLGDTATLNLDFTTGVLDSRLTFTRASTATYINSSGYVTTMGAAPTNDPTKARFDYDPVTLAPRGLLIEGQAVNLAYRSNDFALTPSDGNNWNSSGYTADFTSTLLPDGSTGNARRLSMASASGSYRSSSITVTASTTYTFSFWARNNGGSQARYRVWNVSAGSSIVDYNLSGSNYVASIGGANNTSSAWVRISVTFTTPAGCTSIFVYPCSSDSGTVDLLIWGAQLEAGSGASSYISTGASQVTRNPDYCQSTVASGIAGWLTSLTTSTYFVDFVPMTQRGAFANTWNTRTSTFQGYEIYCFDGTAGVNLTCTTKISASTNVETNVASGLALNSRHKIAYSISAGSGLRSVNGSTVSAANPVALPTGTPSTFGVGSGGGGSGTSINAWIRSVKYYPTALTQTEINGITAA